MRPANDSDECLIKAGEALPRIRMYHEKVP
jgi:hypothetical protein